MLSEQSLGDWDFALVHDFLRLTSLAHRPSTQVFIADHASTDQYDTSAHLGDFGKIWEYLGQPLSVPPPTVSSSLSDEPRASVGEDFHLKVLSDGIIKNKEVRWRDELEGDDLAKHKDRVDFSSVPSLTDSRKIRAGRRNELGNPEQTKAKGLPSGNENESEIELWTPERSQARKAVINGIVHGAPDKVVTDVSTPQRQSGKSQLRGDAEPWPFVGLRVLAPPKKPFISEQDIAYAAAAEKKTRLIAKLRESFVEERQYLNNIRLGTNIEDSGVSTGLGVHVFVDASNIMIGFHDALKFSRGLSITSRLQRQPLSFHNLSLILERGRPSAKRVLVGSDNFPAIQEAKAIGYETNILDRVHKAKELTPRQKKYHQTFVNGTYYATSGQSSGSETTTAMYAPEKWVEQAVDEILHLKILESVIDAKEPSTVVLATGDAAEAEYSQGFLKMVERALEKGWKVEIVSFKHNISGMYKRREFRAKWVEKFKIIELDEFVEEILGV